MLDDDIEHHINHSRRSADPFVEDDGSLLVLKHLAASNLRRTLRLGFYASSEKGFTWGDGVYVSPLSQPLTTMMYGDVGVAGSVDADGLRFFDAVDPAGLQMYQRWIQGQGPEYDLLTTTVHSDFANRQLRNDFRTRFQIDCVIFLPDEPCVHYTDPHNDRWLALTHWNAANAVGYGPSKVVRKLKWCFVSADTFERENLGFKAHLYPGLTGSNTFVQSQYATLAGNIRKAYQHGQVIVGSF